MINKKLKDKVVNRSGGLCEICNSNHMVQIHHIIGGSGKRKQHENEFSLINLCWKHHHGTNGVHGKNGKELDLKLKKELEQRYREQGLEEEEILYLLGGRYYIGVD